MCESELGIQMVFQSLSSCKERSTNRWLVFLMALVIVVYAYVTENEMASPNQPMVDGTDVDGERNQFHILHK